MKEVIDLIGWTVTILIIVFFVAKDLVRSNPCSAWADDPQQCSSNYHEDIK